MSGFQEAQWTRCPWGRKGRKAKSVWVSVLRATGTPPSLIEYLPPRRWTDLPNGDREWRESSRWLIHHEEQLFSFDGSASVVVSRINADGLNEAALSYSIAQGGEAHGGGSN